MGQICVTLVLNKYWVNNDNFLMRHRSGDEDPVQSKYSVLKLLGRMEFCGKIESTSRIVLASYRGCS